jgi:hypothetical protein
MNESFQNVLGLRNDLRKLLQGAATVEFFCIVDDDLDAKYALAFGINLQSQLSAKSQLSGYKSNSISWLAEMSKSSWGSDG